MVGNVAAGDTALLQVNDLHTDITTRQGVVHAVSGVSLCIDTMLHLLKKSFGPDVAVETASVRSVSASRTVARIIAGNSTAFCQVLFQAPSPAA